MVESSIRGPLGYRRRHSNQTRTFKHFRRLPLEVQGMIWSIIIPNEPTLYEVSEYDEHTNEYDITGTAADIMAICGPHNSVPGVHPIYLPRGRDKKMPKPIYIRPAKDILYIPFPEQLDTITMSMIKENKLLTKIGVVSSAFDGLNMGSHMVHETAALPFLTELKNLKQMFIVDGYAKGLEDWEVRPYHRDFTFDFSDVRVGKVGRVLYVTSSWEIWSSAHVDRIRKCFEDQKSVVEATRDVEWVIPEILGKTIWRK